jgi:hypothetical protein
MLKREEKLGEVTHRKTDEQAPQRSATGIAEWYNGNFGSDFKR